MVTLLEAGGEHVAPTRVDTDGVYAFPLPVTGRYVVTMLHPMILQAVARKLAVDKRSVTLDFAARPVEDTSGERVGA